MFMIYFISYLLCCLWQTFEQSVMIRPLTHGVWWVTCQAAGDLLIIIFVIHWIFLFIFHSQSCSVSHFCPDHGWALLPWRSGRTWARTSSSRRSLQKESNYGKPTRILENVFAQSKAFVCTRSVYLCTARVSTEAKKHSSLYPTYVSDTSGYLLVYTVPRSQLLALEISLLLLLICHIVPYLLVSHIMWHIFAQEEMRYNIYHICIHLNQRNV